MATLVQSLGPGASAQDAFEGGRVTITGLHIPCDGRPLAVVSVYERDARSFYPYVQGGPVEAGHLTIADHDVVAYVNSRYADLDVDLMNPRASALFSAAGVGMWTGAIRGDALLVRSAGDGDYERSLPSEFIAFLLEADSARLQVAAAEGAGVDGPTLLDRLLRELPRALADLSVGGIDLSRSRYVQWAGYPQGLHIEVVGNTFLPEPLTFLERRALQIRHWNPPEPPDWPNFFQQFAHPVAVEEVAETIVDAARVLNAKASRSDGTADRPAQTQLTRVGVLPLEIEDNSPQQSVFDFDEADGSSEPCGADQQSGDDDPWAGQLDLEPTDAQDQREPGADLDDVEDEGDGDDLTEEEEEEEDWEPLDEIEIMGDLSDLLDSLPTVWAGDGEREFMIYAWSALHAAGVVPLTTRREHLRAVAALAALHLLRVSFYVHSHDEGMWGVERWSFDDLAGDYPRVHTHWLGVEIAAALPNYDLRVEPDSMNVDEELADIWSWLLEQQYALVIRTLSDSWGENELFCAIWTSTKDQPRYPVPGPVMHEILNGDGTLEGLADRMPAWEWLTNGMSPAPH